MKVLFCFALITAATSAKDIADPIGISPLEGIAQQPLWFNSALAQGLGSTTLTDSGLPLNSVLAYVLGVHWKNGLGLGTR